MHMHRVDISVSKQIEWIKSHQLIDGDYYFLIWNKKGERIGTISLYDKKNDHCEIGRAASIGNSVENIEAFILIYDLAFFEFGYEYLVGTIVPDNWKVKMLDQKFGFIFNEEVVYINGMPLQMGKVTREAYELKRPEIVKLLKKAKDIIS